MKKLSFLHFLNDGIRTTFVILLPFIAKDLSLNFTSVGFLGSSQPLLAGILALPAGFITARIGGFRLLIILLLVYSIGALGVASSLNIFMLIPMFLLGALGFGMFHTVGFILVAASSDKSNVGRNMGNFTSIGDIGRVALPPLAIFAASFFGWRTTMVFVSIIGFVIYVLSQFFLKKEKHLQNSALKKESYGDFIKNTLLLLKIRKLRFVILSGILDSLASNPIYLFLPFLLILKGVTASQLGGLMGAFFVGSLIGKFLLGRGVDKFGNLKIFILSELGMAGLIISLVLAANHLLTLLILLFFLGIFTKGTSPVVQTMFSNLTHKLHHHKIYAVSILFLALAEALAEIGMGPVADGFGVTMIFYLCAVFAISAIIPILVLKKTTLATAASSEEAASKLTERQY